MNLSFFILKRTGLAQKGSFSSFIMRISVAAVALSVSVMIVTVAMVSGFQKEISDKMFGFWAHIHILPFSVSQSLYEEPVSMHQDFYENPDIVEGIKHIQVSANKGAIIKTEEDFEGIILKGVGEDFDWQRMNEYLIEGRRIEPKSEGPSYEILLSRSTAIRLNVDLHDRVIVSFIEERIRLRPYQVVGIYNTGLEEFDKNHALIDIKDIQRLNNWDSTQVGGFEVIVEGDRLLLPYWKYFFWSLVYKTGLISDENYYLKTRDKIDEIADELYYTIENPELNVLSIKSIQPNIFDWLNLQSVNEAIILVLMIVVSTINMITALLILILDRTQMIGVLKTLGTDNWSIRRLFILNAAVIISLGLIIGNFLGISLCILQENFGFIRLPEESYYVRVAPVDLSIGWLLAVNIATLVICSLVLVLPTYLITRISPLKAIRFS